MLETTSEKAISFHHVSRDKVLHEYFSSLGPGFLQSSAILNKEKALGTRLKKLRYCVGGEVRH